MHSLFKKRNKGKYSPTVQKKSISSKELSELIEKLQKNADQVEKNIVEADSKMQNDLHKLKAGQPAEYQDLTADKLIESDKLLYVLDGDAAIARHMKHPQGDMITEDIRQLKERVGNLREKHEQIYNFTPQEIEPQVNWTTVIEEKQEILNSKGFGTDLPSVNGQVEEHNIFHNEVMAIGPHISKEGDKEYMSGLQVKYQKLLSGSQQRQQDLNSLQDYMQRCTNKLYWLDQQAKDRMQFDWSDRNLDYPSRRRQYENFINRNLEEKEGAINKLHEDGNKLLAGSHPGKIPIEAHIEQSTLTGRSTSTCLSVRRATSSSWRTITSSKKMLRMPRTFSGKWTQTWTRNTARISRTGTPAVTGVTFLSGGQSEEEATIN